MSFTAFHSSVLGSEIFSVLVNAADWRWQCQECTLQPYVPSCADWNVLFTVG